jgi:hypothetical protein
MSDNTVDRLYCSGCWRTHEQLAAHGHTGACEFYGVHPPAVETLHVHVDGPIWGQDVTQPTAILTVAPVAKCPKCGYTIGDGEGLHFSIEPYTGTYCLRCFARWVSEHIPRLIVPEKEVKG